MQASQLLEDVCSKNTTILFKGFLHLVEDLKNEHDSHFGKLMDALPEEYHDLLAQANYFDDDKMQHLRKRILDIGNESLRNILYEVQHFTITFDFNN